MVRINIIDPKYLADQHLIAEYNEILMLMGHVKKYPKINNAPKEYCLGKGHISFFKDKLMYLKRRHGGLKTEMKNREFKTNKSVDLRPFDKKWRNNWKPKDNDLNIIKQRLKQKIRIKPKFYTYYKSKKSLNFFMSLIDKSKAL